MKKVNWGVAVLAALLGAYGAFAQDASFVGQWKGTWEGGGATGRFEITIEKGADGKLSGGVSVGQDTGDYVAKFTSVTIEDGALRVRYAYTPDEQADILLSGKAKDGGLAGEWTMVAKGAGADNSFAAGTWTVKK